jgi:stage V sporulation protein B
MGVFAYIFYQAMYMLTKSNTVSLFVAIIFAIIIYAVALLLLKGLSEQDILKFPKGRMLVHLAKKMHLLK